MYKEVISRKKVPLIIIALFAITIMLYIHEMVYMIESYDKNERHVINIALLSLISMLVLAELKIATISYRYSLIAGKLIINKINGKKERNEISVKTSDVLYIGTKSELPKEYKNIRGGRSFCCNYFQASKYICIYKNSESIKSFSFSPSECMVEKIKK